MEREIDQDCPTMENLVDYLVFLHGRMANVGVVTKYLQELKLYLHPSSATLLQSPISTEMLHACKYKKTDHPKIAS